MTKEDQAEIMAMFEPVLGKELAEDILKHRKAKKTELTPRGARSLLREYQATGNAVAAAEEHLNRGWVGFKAEWVMKGKNFTDPHNPMPRRPGDMGDYTRDLMDKFNERTSFSTANDRGTERPMEILAPPRRH